MKKFKKFEVKNQKIITGGKMVKTNVPICGTNEWESDWYDTVYDRFIFAD
jgi:hypothetical protein